MTAFFVQLIYLIRFTLQVSLKTIDGQTFDVERSLMKTVGMVNNFIAEMDENDDITMELPSVNCEGAIFDDFAC